MSLLDDLSKLNDLKSTAASGAISAGRANQFVNGDLGDVAVESVNFGAALAAGAASVGVKAVVKGAKFGLERLIDNEKAALAVLESANNATRAVENAAKTGEIVATVGSFLPGLSAIKTAQVPKVLDILGGRADFLEGKGAIAVEKARDAINKKEGILNVVKKVDLAVTALGAAAPFIAGLAVKVEDAANNSSVSVNQSKAFAMLDEADNRLTGALEKLTDRFELSSIEILEASTQLDDSFTELIEFVEVELTPIFARLDAAEAAINAPIDAIEGLVAKGQPFVNAVSAFTTPFDAFFNFLANPPSITVPRISLTPPFTQKVSLFPAIKRSDIDKVIDFVSDLSGAVLAPLNLVLKPILTPVQNAINSLLEKAFPVEGVISNIDVFDGILADLLAFADVLNPLVARIDAEISALTGVANFDSLAFDAALPDIAKATHFGDDGAEAITGLSAIPIPPIEVNGAVAAAMASPASTGAVLVGGGGDDTLTGSAADDVLIGGADNDEITGGGGEDVILGDDGDDVLNGGAGDDVIDGGAGDDIAVFAGDRAAYQIAVVGGVLVVTGPDGADDVLDVETLRFDDGDVDVAPFFLPPPPPPGSGGSGGETPGEEPGGGGTGGGGSAAPERVSGGADPDELVGGLGGDTLLGGGGDDSLSGQAGDDRLVGGSGNDTMTGGSGADLLIGGRGDDSMVGGGGDDALRGGGGDDDIRGGGGADDIRGNGGADKLKGNGGADEIRGGGGADDIRGGGGGDVIQGNGGADTIRGNGGADEINGGGGGDIIIGGRGNDTLIGGGGPDQFVFAGNDGVNVIRQFQQGLDQIRFIGASDFDDLAVRQTANSALITYRDTTVLLDGENRSAVTDDDFIF